MAIDNKSLTKQLQLEAELLNSTEMWRNDGNIRYKM